MVPHSGHMAADGGLKNTNARWWEKDMRGLTCAGSCGISVDRNSVHTFIGIYWSKATFLSQPLL